MKDVLIVSKTKMGKTGCCIGGILIPEMKSVRLLNEDGSYHGLNTEYKIGQIYSVQYKEPDKLVPPHVENILITSKQLVKETKVFDIIKKEQLQKILWEGNPNSIFQGCIKKTGSNNGYISKDSIPEASTGFWMPDKDLSFTNNNHYRYYTAEDNYCAFKYVGFDAPIDKIPARTIVRVSLAKWWAPEDIIIEKRCYLQISGWY